MNSTELTRTALKLPPEDRLELARRLMESVATPTPHAPTVEPGIRRIEEITSGRTRGLSEEEYRAALGGQSAA